MPVSLERVGNVAYLLGYYQLSRLNRRFRIFEVERVVPHKSLAARRRLKQLPVAADASARALNVSWQGVRHATGAVQR